MKKKRVVVTGLSVVSCFGTDVDKFFESLLIGKSGIKPITYFDCCEYPTRFAGELSDFNFENYLDKKRARRVDPFIGYTMVAGKKGLEDALLIGKSFETEYDYAINKIWIEPILTVDDPWEDLISDEDIE